MCGICGYFRFDGGREPDGALGRMNATLAHRGPDSAGSVETGGVGLAMSRLGIIDLETGRQPIANEDETIWIVCNGEIYNFRELRRELERSGHRFRTGSDCEAALHAYEQWGESFLDRLRGMFALAVYDSRARRLVLARDRAGKKPLFHFRAGRLLLFASEIKALLAHPAVPKRVNRSAVPLYLAHGYVPAPETMFEQVLELEPGSVMSAAGEDTGTRRYWRGLRGETVPASEAEASGRLLALLDDAVKVRLISEVPLGAFLSGGLDSTAVVALMSRHLSRPVKTFSIGFAGERSFDETRWARRAARAFGAEHHEFVVEPDAVELIETLVRHYDQPFGDSSALPMFLLSHETRKHVTVALSGDGGDELFAGYERFAAARLAGVYGKLPRPARALIEAAVRVCPESAGYGGLARKARRFVEAAPLSLDRRYLRLAGLFHNGMLRELTGGGGTDAEAHFARYFEAVANRDTLAQLLFVNAATYLPGDLLAKTDRMSMANSLEVRSPFLDQDLMAFAASLPAKLQMRGIETKRLLKRALSSVVPRWTICRRKHGFGVPVGQWFRGPLKEYAAGLLLSRRALGREYFREQAVRRLVEEHASGRRDHGHRLWALATFELWHRLEVD